MWGCTMNAPEPRGAWTPDDAAIQSLQFGLDPFVAKTGCKPIGQQIQNALAEVVSHVEAHTPLVIVSGTPGTGKSWLLAEVAKVCSDKRIAVRCEDRGDLIDPVLADMCDVLLVDEADSVAPEFLGQLMDAGSFRKKRRTIVLMCLPGSVSRFDPAGRSSVLVQLLPLSQQEAHEFLESGAKSIGRTSLFTWEAAQLVIARSGGSPRVLRRNASLAYFSAASEGQAQITIEQVLRTLETNNFAPLAKNPNEGKSWTKADAIDHSALYQHTLPPAATVVSEAARPRPAEKSVQAPSTETCGSSRAAMVTPGKPPVDEHSPQKREARKLSDYALYGSPRNDYQEALEKLRIERNAQELEKLKRREANRIFYHSWRFGR